ncbi:unnamed protein product [Periconia digitata]|uniref:Uncharacterized protein n=1 Tax=Periconia digitata TaxID=1303443 RepID=A0A9W4UR85_9PLEO|nr:unnamed protein product [Periconia digitata]
MRFSYARVPSMGGERGRETVFYSMYAYGWLASLLIWIISMIWYRGKINTCSNIDCAVKLSVYSPMIEAVRYHDVHFENSLNHSSPYSGFPTVETEEAWDNLHIGIKLRALNKSEEEPWKRLPSSISPSQDIVGGFEVFHQLYCLDLIRQFVYRDYWDYSENRALNATREMVWVYIDQCIQTLRLALTCHGDTTPYLMRYKNGTRTGEEPDFDTTHRCRDFDSLTRWAKAHSIRNPEFEEAKNHPA